MTILVGQPQLLHQKTSLRQSNHTQIILRFMIAEMRFNGLLSAEDIATCLAGYDEAKFPNKSDWTYTRFFFPVAYANGLRLVDQADAVWNAFCRAHEKARFDFAIEIPMQYFARAVEIALTENSKNDSKNFKFSPSIWDVAVEDCSYAAAQEELHLGLPANDLATRKIQ
jgi:hypothetical protein